MAQYNFKMALCEGRHEIKGAVDGSIFKGEVDPLAVDRLENMAKEEPASLAFIDVFQKMEEKHLEYLVMDGCAYSIYVDEDGVEFSVEK